MGNFIRNLEAPRLGVDRYIASRIAAGAGSRVVKGRRAGARYTEGPYKGMTEGQAMEAARQEYARMDDRSRLRWENAASAGDVMSSRERARENQHYAARGLAAGAGTMPSASSVSPTAPAPAAPSAPVNRIEPVGPSKSLAGPQKEMLGTINGKPVREIRQEANEARLKAEEYDEYKKIEERNRRDREELERTNPQWYQELKKEKAAQAFESRWRQDYYDRTGEAPKSQEEQEAWKKTAKGLYDSAPKEPQPVIPTRPRGKGEQMMAGR